MFSLKHTKILCNDNSSKNNNNFNKNNNNNNNININSINNSISSYNIKEEEEEEELSPITKSPKKDESLKINNDRVYIKGYYNEFGNYVEGYYDEKGRKCKYYYDENGYYIESYYDDDDFYIEGYFENNGIFFETFNERYSNNSTNEYQKQQIINTSPINLDVSKIEYSLESTTQNQQQNINSSPINLDNRSIKYSLKSTQQQNNNSINSSNNNNDNNHHSNNSNKNSNNKKRKLSNEFYNESYNENIKKISYTDNSNIIENINNDNKKEEIIYSINDSNLRTTFGLELKNKINSGSHSKIYQGSLNGLSIAFKIFKNDSGRNLFKNEVLILESIPKHPGIINYYGTGRFEGEPCIFLELIETSLYQHMINNPNEFNCISRNSEIKLLTLLIAITDAINHLHSYLIYHVDIHSANILVSSDLSKVKLADFGISKFENNDHYIASTGSWNYCAPEVFKNGRSEYTCKADVFSFGIMLWNMITSKYPSKIIHSQDNNNSSSSSSTIVANDLEWAKEMYQNQSRLDFPIRFPQFYRNIIINCWDQSPINRPSFSSLNLYFKIRLNHLKNK